MQPLEERTTCAPPEAKGFGEICWVMIIWLRY